MALTSPFNRKVFQLSRRDAGVGIGGCGATFLLFEEVRRCVCSVRGCEDERLEFLFSIACGGVPGACCVFFPLFSFTTEFVFFQSSLPGPDTDVALKAKSHMGSDSGALRFLTSLENFEEITIPFEES